ncbi:hypothetical protein HMI54_008035 [Coelomomyces lativittatus]|nr:hypothetical protein HMI54_008035 [Coelomomyces lativittatus]KAJ1503594.1 hypothetical protein HMI56_002062 [Coelomomyces lativittatus]KAJ1506356.1 hypothetical protein HMI55_001214 [Coelomomyces lativittatus]
MDKIANIIRAKLQENKSMLTSGVMLPNSTNIASVIENELSMVPVPMRKITKSKFPSSTTKKKPMGVSDALHKTTPSPFGKKEKPKSPDALVSIDEEVTEKINISSSLLFDDDVEGEEGEEEGISFAEKMKKIQMEKTKDLSTLTPTTSHVDLSSPSSQTTYLTVPSMENTLDPKIKKASKLKVSSAAVVGSVMMGGRKEIQPLSSKKRHELETKSSPSTMLPPIASSPTDSLSTMDEKIGATPIPVTTMTPRLPEKLITKVPTLPKPPTKRMGQLSPGLLPTLPSSLKNVLRSKPSTSTKPKVHPAVVLLTTSPSSELQPVPQTSLSPRPKSPGPTSSLTLPSPTGRKSSTPTLLLKRKSIHGEISSMSPWSSTLKSEGLNEKRMLGLLNSKHGHARLHPAYVDLSEFASMEKYFSNASPSLRFQGRLEAPPTPSTSSMSSSSSPTTPPYPSPSSSSFFSPTELPSLPPRILKLLQEKTMTFPFHQLTQLPWYPSLQPLSPSFTLTQVLTTLGKVLEDPDLPDETKWECVGLLVTLYTSYPMDIADPYTLCVMPLMQVMQHEKKLTQLRAYLVRQAPTWLPQGGKPLLQALITRLGDLDDEVRQVTVQVFLAFQIKSKDQLVWLMKQCDFMMDPKEVWRNPKEKMVTTPRSPSTPPSHPMSMTSIPTTRTTSTSQKWVSHLDGLFDQYQREQSHQRNVSVKKVQAWKIS